MRNILSPEEILKQEKERGIVKDILFFNHLKALDEKREKLPGKGWYHLWWNPGHIFGEEEGAREYITRLVKGCYEGKSISSAYTDQKRFYLLNGPMGLEFTIKSVSEEKILEPVKFKIYTMDTDSTVILEEDTEVTYRTFEMHYDHFVKNKNISLDSMEKLENIWRIKFLDYFMRYEGKIMPHIGMSLLGTRNKSGVTIKTSQPDTLTVDILANEANEYVLKQRS